MLWSTLGNHSCSSLQCAHCAQKACQRYIPPDGLVKGGTEDLVAVLGEAQAGHAFVVGMLKSAQAQATLDLPHLPQQHTHIFGREDEMRLPLQ